MRRTNIIKSVIRVANALKNSGLKESLTEAMREFGPPRDRPELNMKLLESLNRYSVEYRQFTDYELEIVNILDLNGIEDPNNWESIIYTKDDPTPLFQMQQKIKFATEHMVKFCTIIYPKYIRLDISKEEIEIIVQENAGVISFELYDITNVPFAIDRFISLFSSISDLYEVSSNILEQKDYPLTLLGCDTGDEKSFDFLGAAKVMQMVKEILLSLWDRLVFYREIKVSQRLELISQSLPIIEQIAELKKSKKLSPEAAEIMKRKVVSSVEQFVNSGAILPEMEDISNIDPKMLMTPEPKQITEGESAQENN